MAHYRMTTILGITVAALLISGVAVGANEAKKPPRVGDKAPEFTLKTPEGKSLTLSKLQGKRGALLVFFATWCEPCMEEVPHVKQFVEETRDKKILVYGVNVDQPAKVVKRFMTAKRVNYRVLLDDGANVTRAYGVVGIPWIVGVDADGVIRFVGHGLPEGKERADLIKLLTKPIEG